MSKSQVKGRKWETAIVDYLRENGVPHAERRRLNGINDRGDIAGIIGAVIEAKAAARQDLPGWLAELYAEMVNDNAAVGFVWAKKVGKASPADGYIITTPAIVLRLLAEAGYIDGGDREEATQP